MLCGSYRNTNSKGGCVTESLVEMLEANWLRGDERGVIWFLWSRRQKIETKVVSLRVLIGLDDVAARLNLTLTNWMLLELGCAPRCL